MNVKIRPHNLPDTLKGELKKVAHEYILQEIDKVDKEWKWKLTRRFVYAVCLALSDQCGFGSKRCQRVVEGFIEILQGVSEDVYDKNEIDDVHEDKAADNMAAELADRGIVIVFNGDDMYDDIKKIRERKEKESALGAGTHEDAKVINQ